MAKYFIIGGDTKEYGPISADDIQQWIVEGRLSEQSLAKLDTESTWRTLASFPEFAIAFKVRGGGSSPLTDSPGTVDLTRDYELDLGGCLTRGWGLVKENFGILFLSFLVMILVALASGSAINLIFHAMSLDRLSGSTGFKVGYNYLFSAVHSLIQGPLLGGFYCVYLRAIRRQAPGVGEVFAGFQKAFVPLFLGSLVVSLSVGACLLPFNYIFGAKVYPLLTHMEQLSQAGGGNATEIQNVFSQLLAMIPSTLPVLFLCLVPVTYLTVSWQFTLPLILDKQLDFATALKSSWRQVNKHWWQLFGLSLLVGLVSVAGALACCVGVLVTVPIGVAATMFAYETLFGDQKN